MTHILDIKECRLLLIDSAIDIQDASLESRCQEEADKDDRQRRELLRAIGTKLSTSELNIGREAYDINASGSPAFTTVSEESNTGINPAKHALSSDAKTSPTASCISTPASATSPIYQKQTFTRGNQGQRFEIVDQKKVANSC